MSTMTSEQMAQHMTALARANEIRIKNGKTKKKIAALSQEDGFAMAIGVLKAPTPEQRAMTVYALMMSVDRIGEKAAIKMMRHAGIASPTRRIRDLTVRQTAAIAEWMDFEADRRSYERTDRAIESMARVA